MEVSLKVLNYLSSIESGGSVTPCSQLVSPPTPSPTHAHTHTHTHTHRENEPARSVCGGGIPVVNKV